MCFLLKLVHNLLPPATPIMLSHHMHCRYPGRGRTSGANCISRGLHSKEVLPAEHVPGAIQALPKESVDTAMQGSTPGWVQYLCGRMVEYGLELDRGVNAGVGYCRKLSGRIGYEVS